MFTPYDKDTASVEDRIAWALCQIIDDDAPMRWTRYRSAAHCIALNPEVMADLEALRAASGVNETSAATQQQGNWNPEPPCWLVEKREQGRTVAYLGYRLGTFEWMAAPDLATRFVRRQDANGVAECFEFEDVIVAEHIWG